MVGTTGSFLILFTFRKEEVVRIGAVKIAEEELACYLKERPIADPRGNQLFEKFRTPSGGISELIPRIAEILPLCHGSCPDCLGDSRLSFEKGEKVIADRNLLGDLT